MKLYLTDPTSHKNGEIPDNLGDIIIKEAILDNLEINQKHEISWIPLDRWPELEKAEEFIIVLAGANILANKPYGNPYVWRPPLKSWLSIKNLILFGVGWWQYQTDPDILTRILYKRTFRGERILHSVRDSYTKKMLAKCGLPNVLNTGCPTMWKLPEVLVFPKFKPDRVVFTITDYNKNPPLDQQLLKVLLENYRDVYFFPQGRGDVNYLEAIVDNSTLRRIVILERSITAYDDLLTSHSIDYVGTRLHGGIRALQLDRRAFIIAVDNRTIEIARDTHLPMIERTDLSSLLCKVNTLFQFSLQINCADIKRFKRRFSEVIDDAA